MKMMIKIKMGIAQPIFKPGPPDLHDGRYILYLKIMIMMMMIMMIMLIMIMKKQNDTDDDKNKNWA